MGAFELNDLCRVTKSNGCNSIKGGCNEVFTEKKECNNFCSNPCEENNLDSRRIREENIISLKIYDSCRQQDCLTPADLGPARAAECVIIGDCTINEGDIIIPPIESASVNVDRLKVKRIVIVDKEANTFKKGYWDIDLKYVFEYRLVFREADGCIIGSVKANSIFNRKLTLFGSEGSDLVISTDLFNTGNECGTLDAEPFIMIEAKAVALNSDLKYTHVKTPNKCIPSCSDDSMGSNFQPGFGCSTIEVPMEVTVTLGLFSIVKLFRIVDLSVESRGFAIPKECEELSPLSPCNYFDNLEFPMDLFAPPQKPEFFAGISGNIPPNNCVPNIIPPNNCVSNISECEKNHCTPNNCDCSNKNKQKNNCC